MASPATSMAMSAATSAAATAAADAENAKTEQEVYDLVKEKLKLLSTGGQRRSHTVPKQNVLRIKMEYKGEKRTVEVPRNTDGTVSLSLLEKQLMRMYSKSLTMYYTQGSGEVIVAIKSQKELDKAVQLIDRSGQKQLRLILSQHDTGRTPNTSSFEPDQAGTFHQQVVEIAVSESCSSCGAASSIRIPRSAGSSTSSGVQDDWRSGRTPTVPTRWKQGRCLGRGTFGAVYLAYDIDNSVEVVVKRVDIARGDLSAKKTAVGLEADVNLLGTLRHERIVQYLGVCTRDDCLLIFMEFMAGGSVKDLITSYGSLSHTVAARYTRQVLEGLAFLHGKDIVHRDIKSANILRDLNGNVKIGDFGSGKRLQALATHQGSSVGTAHYMAPEVVLGKTRFGRKADIWSVGITLIEMLTAKVPYRELADMEVMLKIAYENPKIDLPDDVPQQLHLLVQKMMTKEPDSRPFAAELLATFPWNTVLR